MKRIFLLTLVHLFVAFCAAQPPTPEELLNDSIEHIPLVFEGLVENTELYLGDAEGRKISAGSFRWQGSAAAADDRLGKDVFAFTRATIRVCRLYKGSKALGQRIVVLTKTRAFTKMWFERRADGDTILRYQLPDSEIGAEHFRLFLPHSVYGDKRLFFCRILEVIQPADYLNRGEYANMSTFVQVPVDCQPPTLTSDRSAHAVLFPYIFRTAAELSTFFEKIRTLTPRPPNGCDPAGCE
jgi:hypothetical protein